MNPAKYACHQCDREDVGVTIGATGWWSYPAGWFIKGDDVVCSEACAVAFDGPKTAEQVLVDEKVADIGSAAVAGFFAGLAARSVGNLITEAAMKVTCMRCGRPFIDHAKKPDDKCAGFEAPTWPSPLWLQTGTRVRAAHDLHFMASRDELSGWVQVAGPTGYGFTIGKGTLGKIVSANSRSVVVRWDKSMHDLETTISSVEKFKEE